ncbi:P-loop containing nucleoside triphosphate hydrolase protein, partial [Mycena vitilis]
LRCITQQRLCRHVSSCRPLSQGFAASRKKSSVNGPVAESTAGSFESLGLHPPIVSALRTAFPNITRPTPSQQVLIPSVLAGQDIFLQDQTGSGKSFGLVLALLNKTRAVTSHSQEPAITSIFVVPHRDLAYQFHQWVERLFAPTTPAGRPSSINSIAQVLVRDGQQTDLTVLRQNPPHLLFATPHALLDACADDSDALQLKTLSTIVLDEADYLVPTVDGSRKRKGPMRKRHPAETREFLNAVYGENIRVDSEDDEYVRPERDRSPQLIVSSATLPRHLAEYFSEESSWVIRDNWVNISGTSVSRPRKSSEVTHSVLVVSDDMVRNITGALPPSPSSEVFHPVDADLDAETAVYDIDPALVRKYVETTSPFNPLALETIATIFATDVPRIALLVLPSTAPVQRAVYELREVGITAHSVDWLRDQPVGAGVVRSNPILLVSTWANTRGLDVGELSHVFVLGIPDGGTTGYVHIAGRVGRLEKETRRRRGKVVMVVAPSEEEAARGLLKTMSCEPVELIVSE